MYEIGINIQYITRYTVYLVLTIHGGGGGRAIREKSKGEEQ